MNRKESDLLIQLEKQYSKRSSYGKLFSEIIALKSFDEDRFLSRMKKNGLSEKSLKDSAKYLVDQIIRILSFYGKAPNADLHLLLDGAELLYAFGAINQAEKLIKKGKTQARKRELIGIEIEFLSHEAKILNLSQNREERIRIIEKNLKLQKEANKKHSEKIQYQELYLKSLYLIETILPLGEESENREKLILELRQNPLLSPEYKPHTQTALLLKNSILQALYNVSGQPKKFYESLLETAHLIQENRFLLEHNPRILARVSFQAALYEIQQKNEQAYLSHVDVLKTLLNYSAFIYIEVYLRIKICELSWIYQNGQSEQIHTIYKDLKAKLQDQADLPIQQVFNVYFLISLICLRSGNFSLGVKISGQSLDRLSRKVSTRDEFLLRILQILHLFEIGYKEVASARIDALNQFLYRKKSPPKGWSQLKSFLSQLMDASSEDEIHQVFQNFLKNKEENEAVISLLAPIEFFSYCRSRGNGNL